MDASYKVLSYLKRSNKYRVQIGDIIQDFVDPAEAAEFWLRHVRSGDVTSRHITSPDVHADARMSRDLTSHQVTSHDLTSRDVTHEGETPSPPKGNGSLEGKWAGEESRALSENLAAKRRQRNL